MVKIFWNNLANREVNGQKVFIYILATLFVTLSIVFIILWASGFFTSGKEIKILKEDIKANKKIAQAALAQAEKDRKFADEIIIKNRQIEEILNKKDKKLQEEITKSDEIRDKTLNQINQTYRDDIDAISTMSDEQRDRDICTRWERLAADNPAFNVFKCK